MVYDNNGNIIDNGTYTFEYDYKNRLLKVTNGTGTIVQYSYDVLGRRYEKTTTTKTINYVYSNENVLVEYTTINGQTTKKEYFNGLGTDNLLAYSAEEPNLTPAEREELSFCNENVLIKSSLFIKYGWQLLVDRCNNLASSGSVIVENTYYYAKNNLGSIDGITDNRGSLVTSYNYDSFGNFTMSGYDIGNDRLYTGREYDSEIGLYYLRARYYDSNLGRFISRDPIGQVDDVNLYAYVGNNPVSFVDLFGREKQLLKDIENGNVFAFELVARKLQLTTLGVHTYIIIYSMDKNFNVKTYSMGGHDINGKLVGEFNDKSDLGWKGDIKGEVKIPIPEGYSTSNMAGNLLNEYNSYNKNTKNYYLFGAGDQYDNGGNCNNYSTTILERASGGNQKVQDVIKNFNPFGLNPGLGEAFSKYPRTETKVGLGTLYY